jgi:HTH-type transcriptional regulator, sugar sensing transcriptional regulator
MVVDLLQQVGLNKYEAEAYAALVEYGPLTGYELGKRSGVPLSRSYEILERLTTKGLALIQPGDPPRYAAEAPQQFLDRMRAATTATWDALARALAELGQSALPAGFWVVRGQDHILAQVKTLIAQAQRALVVLVAPAYSASIEEALAQARGRGCRVMQPQLERRDGDIATALLVVDDRDGLVGTLEPASQAQAVSSANPAFVAALVRSCTPALALHPRYTAESNASTRAPQPLDWLEWEQRKQRSLLSVQHKYALE